MTSAKEYIAKLKAANIADLQRIRDMGYEKGDDLSVYRSLGMCNALADIILNNLETIENLMAIEEKS